MSGLFSRFFEDTDELYGSIQRNRQAAEQLSADQLPLPVSGSTIVVVSGGSYASGTLGGTTDEISITQAGTVLTAAFASSFILKGANTASAARTAIGLGTAATQNQAAASADSATSPGAAYVQAEVVSILTELRDLKTQLRASGLLAT